MIVHYVAPGVWRGVQPLDHNDWDTLEGMGIKYTLDLESGAHLMMDGSPLDEQLKAEVRGIHVYAHPLGEILPPTKGELALAVAVMTSRTPIYVHCKAGVDRTGMVCAAYRMEVQGWDKKRAIAEMKDLGMHWWYFFWRWFL